MRRMVGATLLPLVLAGCASGGDLFHQEPAKPAAPAAEAVPQGLPQQATPRSNLSPAASAAAPPPDASESRGELMECVTQSCKINCSPKVAVRYRPKWCASFKEPAE
jgi:hypothetical protein